MDAEDLQFPKPSGPLSLGYRNFEVKDKNRKDPYNTWHSRRLKVTVWYPSKAPSNVESYGQEEIKLWERELKV